MAPASAPLENAPDVLLVSRVWDDDPAAFEVLTRRYARMMKAYATRLLGSPNEADDVVQDALVDAWRTLETLRDGSKVKNWLLRITAHKSIDTVRSRRLWGELDEQLADSEPSRSPAGEAVRSSAMDALSASLDRLEPAGRRCWLLKEVGGFSYAEIAQLMDTTVTVVRGRLSRARSILVKEMEPWR